MSDFKQQALATAKESATIAQDAVISKGWLYPIYGIPYFFGHKKLYAPLLSMILPSLAISAGVLSFFFIFTYVPQGLVLSTIQLGPWGFISAFALVLTESSYVINIILKNFIFADVLVEVFDNVLLINGLDDLVKNGRELSSSSNSKGGKQLGKLISKPFDRLQPAAIVKYLMSLFLNAIPVVGTVVFFFVNGYNTGPSLLSRYHQLKFSPSASSQSSSSSSQPKPSKSAQANFIHHHRGAYTALGVVSFLLTLVPVVGSVVGAYTNTVGAALLAVDFEKKQGKVREGERELAKQGGGGKKEL